MFSSTRLKARQSTVLAGVPSMWYRHICGRSIILILLRLELHATLGPYRSW